MGESPTFEQIREALNYDDIRPVYTNVRELEAKGYLAMRSSNKPEIVPQRKGTGAWLQEPSIRQTERIPVVGRFKHGFLAAAQIKPARGANPEPLGWLEQAGIDPCVDFALYSDGFAGLKDAVPSGSLLLCSMRAYPEEDHIIVERVGEDWKLARFSEDKVIAATVVKVVPPE